MYVLLIIYVMYSINDLEFRSPNFAYNRGNIGAQSRPTDCSSETSTKQDSSEKSTVNVCI